VDGGVFTFSFVSFVSAGPLPRGQKVKALHESSDCQINSRVQCEVILHGSQTKASRDPRYDGGS
jgi:hypothetical protein